MEETTDPPQKTAISPFQREDEEPSVSPALSYQSMKSDRSMEEPIGFKKGHTTKESTQICIVHPARSESPTLSHSVTSDSSMEHPINYNDGGLTEVRPEEDLCDSCSDFNISKRAVKTCQTCSSSYCEPHIRKHYTEARFQTHHVVDVPAGLPFCQKHHKPKEVFCLTDQMFVCSQCSYDIFHETHQAVRKMRPLRGEGPISKPPTPARVAVRSINTTSVQLTWDLPGPINSPISFKVTWNSGSVVTTDNRVDITGLRSETEYSFSICTTDEKGTDSDHVTSTIRTKCSLKSYLKTLGLEQSLEDKLTLNETLAINAQIIDPKYLPTAKSQLRFFLRELIEVNVLARDKLSDLCDENDLVNPLDLITALFLSSDHFLQQEMTLKMSLCQFAVPLLLPNCETQQITLMLWAMRNIVKRYRSHSLDQKEYVEDSIVLADLPTVSFVRLGYSSLSKSELLNDILSKSQQRNNSFVHRNMTGGNSPRQISDGLVEVSWCFPCGNKHIDVFSQPVAVANLRGDIQDFPTQFEFLCKTSAAVFVFCDGFSSDRHVLKSKHLVDRQLFVVSNTEAKGYDAAAFELLELKRSAHIKKGSQMNNVQLVQKLHSLVTDVVKTTSVKSSVEKMAEEAKTFNIHVDENFKLCQTAKENACSITDHISDISDFKMKNLPLHGEILVKLVKVVREQSRLKYAGRRNIEDYKSELRMKLNDLRTKQVNKGVNIIMTKFIDALQSEQSSFFLKWMKINLDNHSREHLSKLRQISKDVCEISPGDKTKLSDLGKSPTSLGIEHFLRELGQLYESAQSLPEDHRSRQQVKDLPRICAQLMLGGFPLELIDGDASYIPMKWISGVLREVHSLVPCNSKVRVITVLGVQSSGKSTLLNTMFGVQFAVSGGRCTRGAFMQLIKVEEDLKEKLDCDFIMVIDTEGLKAPELAQLDNSYEHDNELATLVVGLSDITIINIPMENAAEMKEILQIVVHAFLRMKEVGKKHMCQFVYQNVPDCSAHAKSANDRKLQLQQLNVMTEVAAKMEKKEHNKMFTDIMDYDPEEHSCFLPSLWFGNPPMAAVNAGYSEAVSDLKKTIIQRLIDAKTPAVSILQFCELTQDVWDAVKHENFIFSFRNSLEADAYNTLSVEFNKWEFELRKHMQSWWQQAEVEISNYSIASCRVGIPSHLEDLTGRLKGEYTSELEEKVKVLMQKLTQYLETKEKYAHLSEKYRDDFVNSAQILKRETQNSLRSKLKMAVECKKDLVKIEKLKETQSNKMEEQVMRLLDKCRNNPKCKRSEVTPEDLKKEFDQTWEATVKSLDIRGLHKQDIDTDILRCLRNNMERKAGSAQEILIKINRLDKASDFNKDCLAKSKKWFQEEIKIKCERFIDEKRSAKSDYHSMYTIHILKMIDDSQEKFPDLHIDAEFEANLKIQICGHASREFQKMQTTFLEINDPLTCLEKFKPEYFRNFKDLFYERDQCDRKAGDFTKLCLEPAVKEHVDKSLGYNILREVLNDNKYSVGFRTRTFFQFSVLNDLLLKGEFKQFEKYINEYPSFVEAWIFQRIVDFFSGDHTFADSEEKQLARITGRIEEVIKCLESSTNEGNTKTDANSFIEDICWTLSKDLVIPKDALKSVLHLNKAQMKPFSDRLKIYVREMKQSLSAEYHKHTDLTAKLKKLPLKPQEELFDRLFGCGKTCPFCHAPCEASGTGHKEHFVTIHRPQGLGNCQRDSKHLLPDICSSQVASESRFRSPDTNDVFHPFKNYRSIYPDWRIQPDPSIEASDYWKYVFGKYNQQFADEYDALPAVIPDDWRNITQERAVESLQEAYRRKAHSSSVSKSPQ